MVFNALRRCEERSNLSHEQQEARNAKTQIALLRTSQLLARTTNSINEHHEK